MTNPLRVVRIHSFRLIPRRLFESIKARAWSIDLLMERGAELAASPKCLLYAWADEQYEVHGVLFATFDDLTNSINGHVLSFDPEYQDGSAIPAALAILKKAQRQFRAKKITMATTRPKAMERYGFKRSPWTRMEM